MSRMTVSAAGQGKTRSADPHAIAGGKRIDALNALFEASRWEDLDRALEFCQEACLLAKTQGDTERLAYSSGGGGALTRLV